MFSIRTRQLPPPRRAVRGFSLVEIMVGMVIGMIGIIVMMQMMAVTEGQKRATTGAGDAQMDGAIALYALQRDLRQAGYGATATTLFGCNVTLRPGVTLNTLGPVTINHAAIPAGDPNTDTLLLVYGNANSSPHGEVITDSVSDPTPPYTVGALASFAVNDRVIAVPPSSSSPPAPPSPCNLVLDTVAAVTSSVSVASVASGSTLVGQGLLFNLGQRPRVLAYAIHRGNLTVCDYMTSNCATPCSALDGPTGTAVGGSCNAAWVPVAGNTVSLRAEYGSDTSAPMDAVVDTYDQGTPTTTCGWARMSAVRVALVMRSVQFEKTAVTTAAPAWAGSTGATPVLINLSNDPNWQSYRYRVFQTTVPLRNLSWLGAQAGC